MNSLSDWPISYRRASFSWDEAAKRLKVSADILPNFGSPPRDDEELLRAWKEEACALSEIESQELAVVRQQRESRGTLMDWLYQGLGESCPSCLQGLYESGGRYQDALLETIHELYQDVGSQIPALHAVQRPARCEGRSVPACIATACAAIMLAACASGPIVPTADNVPPTVLATIEDAGVRDLRGSFRAATCSRLPANAPACDDVLLRLPGEEVTAAPRLAPDLPQRFRIAFVPGFLSERFDA